MKTGVILMFVMAFTMIAQGLALGGRTSQEKAMSSRDEKLTLNENSFEPKVKEGIQIVKRKLNPYRDPEINIKKDIPALREITADEKKIRRLQLQNDFSGIWICI